MAVTTEHTTTRPKRGTRGRPDRPSRVRRARHGATAWTAAEHAAAAERAEALALAATRAAAPPGAREAYARRFRSRLLEEVERIGTVDAAALVLAHSRAALATWKGSGLHPVDAEHVRLEVLAEGRASLGVEAVRGAAEIGPWGDLVEHAPGETSVPRGRAVEGERPRRGGRR